MTETDGIPFKGLAFGTIMKHKTLDIYCKWKNDLPVTDQELHCMACGLSSILNLTNTALAIQFLDCTREELEKISRSLIKNEECKIYQLPELVNQSYDIAVSVIDREHDCEKTITYISKVKTNSPKRRSCWKHWLTLSMW